MKDLVKKAGLEAQFHVESAATSTEEVGNPVYPPARRKLAPAKLSPRLCGERSRSGMSELATSAGSEGYGACGNEVTDPWYTDDFETTWRDVLAGHQGLLAACQERNS